MGGWVKDGLMEDGLMDGCSPKTLCSAWVLGLGWVGGWIDGRWMDEGWMDGWMEGWMNG